MDLGKEAFDHQTGKGKPHPTPRFPVSARLLLTLVLLFSLGLGASPGRPQGSKAPGSGGSRPHPAVDPARQFTIVKIDPDAVEEEVRISFSKPIPLESLKGNLRLLPMVKIDWPRAVMSPQGILTLKGNFKFGTGYLVTLPENLTVGKLTYVPTVHTFAMPDRPPKVEFVDGKTLIERDSRQLLHVRAQNVKTLVVEDIRIPPLLLPQALAVEESPSAWGQVLARLQAGADQLNTLARGNKAFTPFLAAPVEQRQVFPAGGEKNKLLAVSVPLSFRPGKEAGALELIRVKEDQADRAVVGAPRVFRITDLGITYKTGPNRLLLWITSLKNGTPVAGAQVVGITTEMGVFPLGQTDDNGILIVTPKELAGLSLKTVGDFQPVQQAVDPEQLVCVLAGTANDVSFIRLQPTGNLQPEGIWQVRAGEKIRRFKGQVFTERGVYRPGDTVHFKGLVREYLEGRIVSPAGETCTFEIMSPKEEKVFSQELTLSDFGSAAGALTTALHWPVGTYTLTMSFGPEESRPQEPAPRGRSRRPRAADDEGGPGDRMRRNETVCTFQVQEFKAPRHFVEIDFQRFSRAETGYVNREARPREFVRIGLAGAYYAGGPVKHGQVRWKVHKAKTSYQVPSYDTFVFGYAGEEPGELIESGQAILDEKGRTELEFPLDQQMLTGQYGFLVVASVVDFDGRAASNSKTYQADPDMLVGISSHPAEVQAGEEQSLKVVAVTRDGKAMRKGQIRAEVLERSWGYVAKRNEQGDVYWDEQETWRKTFATDLSLEKGEASFRFDFAGYGRYLVAFTYRDDQGRSYASATSYQVATEPYLEPEKRERPYQVLALAPDRTAYAPGQTARIAVRPKRPVSRYLVTLEQEGILQHQVITPNKDFPYLEIPIRAQYAPNVYLSVLALTPRGEFPAFAGRYDTEAPGFFWGNLNLPVRLEVEPLKVQISPEVKELKAEPGATVNLDFTVLTPKGRGVEAEMAVAVVDEAVLALTGFKTPTLEQLVRFDGPLGVFTGELRTLLMHQTPFYLARNEPLTGGGGLSAEMVAKLRRRFEPVAYFNPAVRTDPSGRARVSFVLPDTMTSYRVYAVAVDRGSRFASPERSLVATKDFYLEPGMPSFFTQGDRFTVQVAAFNTTKAGGPLKFTAAAEGGLSLKAEDPPPTLNPMDSLKLAVNGAATKAGPAVARFGAEFQGRTDAVELKLPIKSGHVRDTAIFSGTVTGPSQVKVTLPPYVTGDHAKKLDWGEVQAILTISGSPFLRMTDAIHYLLAYPYGCVEQTASGILALAALRGLISDQQMPGVDLLEVDQYLNRGITRILGMQIDSGGFGYWPGYREPHLWGSIYAAAALTMAKTHGFTVPADALEKTVAYLQEQIGNDKVGDGAKAFACYLLALHQALERGAFKAVSQRYDKLTREGKLLLLLAAREAGFRPLGELKKDLPPLLGPEAARETGEDDFNARYRGPALALLAAKAMLPEDPRTQQAALLLLGGLDRQGIWTSTSDTGWGLLALGEYFQGQKFGAEPEAITISQPGAAAPHRLELDPRGYRTMALDPQALLKHPVVQIQAQPGATWLYKLELTAPREDIAATGAAHGFKVQKTIKNTDGSPDIKVGDLVKVTVVVQVAGTGQRYTVMDDPLPAGLMAVNTALKTEEPLPEGSDRAADSEEEAEAEYQGAYVTREGALFYHPNFFEIRDDRVLAFRDWVYSGKYVFEYYARAVCAGQFTVPATKVAAMYAPGVNGHSPRSEVTIKGR